MQPWDHGQSEMKTVRGGAQEGCGERKVTWRPVPAGSNGKRERAAPQPAQGRHDAQADAGPMGGRPGQRRGPEESELGLTEAVGRIVWPSRERQAETAAAHTGLPESSGPPPPLHAWFRCFTKRRQREA